MSLGAGAWRVSGWPDATSREEVSMATLEAGTTPKAVTNRHRHTEKENFSGDTYPWEYLPENYVRNHQPPGREGGEGARIRNASPKRNNWSATISKQSNNTPIANMATIAPKRGFSVATPSLRVSCVSFQVLRASQYQVRLQFLKAYILCSFIRAEYLENNTTKV